MWTAPVLERLTYAILVAGLVLAAALVHLVAGWVVSNGIHSEVLAVRDRPKSLEVRVRGLSRDHIVLEAPGPRQDIGHPGILGLSWDDGYARLGEVVEVVGPRIKRGYQPIRGTPPICQGPLVACPPVEIDGFAYPRDPRDVGLSFDDIHYESPLGEMGAWLVPGGDGGTWAILCHGWTAARRELLRMLPAFHDAAFTSLVIDYRNDPGAPSDPSGRYRFGLGEWEDLEGAVRFALSRGAERMVLGGCSTGGTIVMSFLERSTLGATVAGVFLDAPNLILADTIRHGAIDRRATPLMFEFGLWIADLRWKVDWNATNYVTRAAETLTVPTLVFHGTSDKTVPIAESRQLQAAARDVVELVETPAAGHVLSWNADPERYNSHLGSFLERI